MLYQIHNVQSNKRSNNRLPFKVTQQFLRFQNNNARGLVVIQCTIKSKTIKMNLNSVFIFALGQQPPVDQGLLIIEASWTHSDTPHWVGLLWTSDQSDAETSTWHHKTLTQDGYPCHRRDSNPQSQQASGPYQALDSTKTGIGCVQFSRTKCNCSRMFQRTATI
jgi:hypothetical protein